MVAVSPKNTKRRGSSGSGGSGGCVIKTSWILAFIIGFSIFSTLLLNGHILNKLSKASNNNGAGGGGGNHDGPSSVRQMVEGSSGGGGGGASGPYSALGSFANIIGSAMNDAISATFPDGYCDSDASLEPIDLNVNHLKLIPKAPGSPPSMDDYLSYESPDFLPVVVPSTTQEIHLRFRLKPKFGSTDASAIKDITAYKVEIQATGSEPIWDSGKVMVDKFPQSIQVPSPWNILKGGMIVQWKIQIWDYNGKSCTSPYTKFAIGPTVWTGQWIVHPDDANTFHNSLKDSGSHMNWHHTQKGCNYWKERRPLPLARSSKFIIPQGAKPKSISSALLVASGLGYFAVSLNGKALSTSSILDPPMTDFSQRVSYRGYDVTSLLNTSTDSSNVIGITLGSGWWDGRPLDGGLIGLNMMPRGPIMAIAELHISYEDGTTEILVPTSPKHGWEMTKGYILDADLITGDTVDIMKYEQLKGWDTPNGASSRFTGEWKTPEIYRPDVTTEEWRKAFHKYGVERNWKAVDFRTVAAGKLVASTAPPVLPQERLEPESIVDLGDGRWMYDFGKAFSGIVRFEDGLPTPLKKEQKEENYPRGHFVENQFSTGEDDSYITVVYGDSIQMETGDINLLLVAAMGLHDGGPRGVSKPKNTIQRGGACYPKDHGNVLTQRDVWIVHKDGNNKKEQLFEQAPRQALFTSHGFRYAEVCCTAEPPKSVYAVAYRTSFEQRGQFDSSNVNLNGAWEMVLNAFKSNMLGWQTDCPHRERLQYGGDISANSPASLHMFDMSAFYTKIIKDWIDTQWDNGAYTETSIFQNLNGHLSIGKGSGETVWASLPAVLSVRHMQYYGDKELLALSLEHHMEWLNFLGENWEEGMKTQFGQFKDLAKNYNGDAGGLGDWLSMGPKDSWLTHHAYYMASARAVAYVANQLDSNGGNGQNSQALATAKTAALELVNDLRKKITDLYSTGDAFQLRERGLHYTTPGADIGLFARIVPGEKRCNALRDFIKKAGSGAKLRWPGSEEEKFFDKLNKEDLQKQLDAGEITKHQNGDRTFYNVVRMHRHTTPEGILALRYTLKALSDNGFHSIALSKAAGDGCPSFGFMLSFNATTMWETWWRSEDFTSRNHPMFGAVGEWLATSVAGVAMSPTTVGAEELLFWPRIPQNAVVVKYASAIQGTPRGDSAIAWRFSGLGSELDKGTVEVQIRILIPPATKGVVRVPKVTIGDTSIRKSLSIPDLDASKADAESTCQDRRKAGMGYQYNWEYDRFKEEWSKRHAGRPIGTPCESFLFDSRIDEIDWSEEERIPDISTNLPYWEFDLDAGLYDILLKNYQMEPELPDQPGYEKFTGDIGGFCSDQRTFEWSIDDATHII